MATLISTDLEPVRVQAYGNWFEFKPGQIKPMNDNISDFLCTNRRDKGFVALPDSYFDDPNSPESQKIKEAAIVTGRTAIVTELKKLRHNFEISTQKDIDISGEKRSFMTEANAVHKEMYRRLALFKNAERDLVDGTEDEIKKFIETIDGPANRPNASKAVARS